MKFVIHKTLFFLGIYLSVLAISAVAQDPAQPQIGDMLANASKQSTAYVEAFKNLLSDETKSFEIYDKNGEVKKRRVVVSNFIVYQFTKDPDRLNEYRNIISVDGKKIDKADKRAQDFFTEIQRVENSQDELKKLRDESLRYDEDIFISGLTLFQSLALAENLRPFFDYNLEGRESLNGHDVYVVSYRQIKASPDIKINSDEKQIGGKQQQSYDIETDKNVELNGRLSGKFWVDAGTFQVWKEHRELTVQPDGFSQPLAAIENDFEYQNSGLEILVPKTISHTQYRIKIKDRRAIKEAKVTFEYGKFTKPDVEVKSSEVKHP